MLICAGHGGNDDDARGGDEPRHRQEGHDGVAGRLPRQAQGLPRGQLAARHGGLLQPHAELPEGEDEEKKRRPS